MNDYIDELDVRMDNVNAFNEGRLLKRIAEIQEQLRAANERADMAWRGLANLYAMIEGQKCDQAVALGMATSAVDRLLKERDQVRAELATYKLRAEEIDKNLAANGVLNVLNALADRLTTERAAHAETKRLARELAQALRKWGGPHGEIDALLARPEVAALRES